MIANDSFPHSNDAIAMTFWLSVLNLPFALLWAVSVDTWSLPTGTGWGAMLFLGFATVAAMVTLVKAIRGLGAALTGLAMNIEPVGIIVLAALLVGEALTWSTVLGMGLVVTALMLVGWPRSSAR